MSDHHEEPSQAPQPKPVENEITFFAQTNFRNQDRRFGIKIDDRRRHMYVIGKTGMGKSTLLENMIIQDIQNGKGVAVVDPHGDLVEKVVNFVPSNRINDVVYFNPSDVDFPIAFNILENVGDEYKNLVSNGLVGVFKKIWADSWGPRLEYILINAILALLEYPGSTLLGVTRMLVDPKYRKKVVHNITDPVVKSFWLDEYNNYTEKFRNEAIAPIQNKVGQFLSSSLIRNIVGQAKSTINMRELMDSGKIVLMNLSKGRIGEENAALLGAMMITKIQLAAMSRVDIPEPTRRDFYLYVDEFQNFSTESFANILSEARKYRLNLIMAHQYIEQLSDEVKAAVFGNVGTLISFRVGATDAEELEKEFQPTFMQEDIVTLPAHHVYLRLMIDGVASEPFSASTLPPISGLTNQREKVIQVSRERYGRDRASVEDKIRKWAGYAHGEGGDDDEEDGDEESVERSDGPQKRFDDSRRPAGDKGSKGDRGADRKGPKPRDGKAQGGEKRSEERAGPKPADKPRKETTPAKVAQPKQEVRAEKPEISTPIATTLAAIVSNEPKVPKPPYVAMAPSQMPAPVSQPLPPIEPVVHEHEAVHELEEFRSKKLSFVALAQPAQPVARVMPVSQPQPRAAQQPRVQQPQPKRDQPQKSSQPQRTAPPAIEFHSLAEAMPGDILPQQARPQAPREERVEPEKPKQQTLPQTVQHIRPSQPQQPLDQNQQAVTTDGKKRRRRRRKRKNAGQIGVSGTPVPSMPGVESSSQPQQSQMVQSPRFVPTAPATPVQPRPVPPQQPVTPTRTPTQPIQPGQAIHFD